MHPNDIVQAEATLQNLHCNGENHPHMCWAEFKQLLNDACAVLRKKHKQEISPEDVKIQSSLGKTRDLELKHLHAIIIQRAKDKPGCSFLQHACPQTSIKGHMAPFAM